jgi:hypothetical protein
MRMIILTVLLALASAHSARAQEISPTQWSQWKTTAVVQSTTLDANLGVGCFRGEILPVLQVEEFFPGEVGIRPTCNGKTWPAPVWYRVQWDETMIFFEINNPVRRVTLTNLLMSCDRCEVVVPSTTGNRTYSFTLKGSRAAIGAAVSSHLCN